MPKQTLCAGRVLGGIILLILLLISPLVTAQEQNLLLRLSRNVPGEAHPITLYADDVVTWTEGGRRVVLLKGKAYVEHNLVSLRAQQVAAWIDEGAYQKTHIYHVEVFGEGEVRLENGPEGKAGTKALVELNTRGQIILKAKGGKIVQETHADDPFYRRALAEKEPPAMPPSPPKNAPPSAPKPAAALPYRSSYESADNAPLRRGVVRAQAPGPAEPEPTSPLLPPVAVPEPPARDAGGQPLPPPPGSPGLPPPPGGPAPPNPAAPAPTGPPRNIAVQVAPRSTAPFHSQSFPLPDGEQAVVVTGGIIMNVRSADAKVGLIDIEADELVFWTRGNTNELFDNMKSKEGQTTREMEFYLAGNVEIRQKAPLEDRLLRADEVYYDVGRSVAVAVNGDMELRRPQILYPIHFHAEELDQLGPYLYEGKRTHISASKLPSDPGIDLYIKDATLETRRRPRRSIFGKQFYERATGKPEEEQELLFTGWNNFLEIEGVPVFYFPYLHGNARNPLGPITNIGTGYSQIFGFQAWVTFDVYQLLGIDPIGTSKWRLDIDDLSMRGPAAGTNFDYSGKQAFNWGDNKYIGSVVAWGIDDRGYDNLGGGRGVYDHHPEDRGRFTWRDNWWDLPYGFTIQSQVSLLSDQNFLEQYYKLEFDQAHNQNTFLYVKQQQDIWAWSVLTEPRVRRWVTETEWLPRADGWLLGESFLDRFTYNVHASVAYAQLRPTVQPPFPYTSTDSPIDTGRFDLWQEVSFPFQLGPLKVVPYGVVDLTEYTDYLNNSPTWPASDTGQARGRFYGAGGVRASLPLTRLYPDVESDLFNLNGINHKIRLNANYYSAYSDIPFYRLPQLDRINDDATDHALRDITPLQTLYNPAHGLALQTETLFNPQFYAIRRLVNDLPDTLESIEELQLNVNQRWQTKRGYPGMQHIVDWMTLDLSATYFPHPTRDNFGSSIGILEYDWTWNIGDRTAVVSSGWYDPFDTGGRVTTIGAFFNRPDRTNFFLGYRQIDFLQSRAVTASVSYAFSPKYSVTAASVYDFGISEALANSLTLTRMGTDVQISVGISYNALQNNFGFSVMVIPNLVPQAARLGGLSVAPGQPGGAGIPFAH